MPWRNQEGAAGAKRGYVASGRDQPPQCWFDKE